MGTETNLGGREKRDANFYGGAGVRRKQTYEVELRRAIRKTGVRRGGVGWIELLLFKLPKHDSNWYGTRTLLTKNEPPRPKKSIRDR